MIKYKKSAFTLSEILITLGVIGVVSAMTLPTLVKNYQKKVTVERLKVVYSTISQAVKMSEIDNGPISDWNIPDYDSYDSKDFCEKYLKPYIKNIKECNGTRTQCLGEKAYYLNGKEFVNNNLRYYLVFNNQITITPSLLGTRKIVNLNVDINGNQKPNTYGIDIFSIIIAKEAINNKDGIIPASGVYMDGYGLTINKLKTSSTSSCSKDKSVGYAGSYCGAWIQKNGWKIPDDYPW